METVDGKSEFTYDRTGQLTVVDTMTGSGVMPEEDFSFDANGNRDSGDYGVSSDNRMSQSPAEAGNHYEYTYDEEGNRIVRYLKNASGNTLETTTYSTITAIRLDL